MRSLLGKNPDVYIFGNYLPEGKRKLCVIFDLTEKDILFRKLKANIRAVNKRLRLIADNKKRTEEMAKIKAQRAATLQKEQEDTKGEKPKKAPEEGKGKKMKAGMKAAPPTAWVSLAIKTCSDQSSSDLMISHTGPPNSGCFKARAIVPSRYPSLLPQS